MAICLRDVIWSEVLQLSLLSINLFYIFSKTDNSNGLTVLRKYRKIRSWSPKVEQLSFNCFWNCNKILFQKLSHSTLTIQTIHFQSFYFIFYNNYPFLNFYYFFFLMKIFWFIPKWNIGLLGNNKLKLIYTRQGIFLVLFFSQVTTSEMSFLFHF